LSEGRNQRRDRDALARLGARLKRARETSRIAPPERPPEDVPATGLGVALRVAVDMVAGVGVGAGMGYVFDQWFGTSPWLLIVFFFLGAAAGGLNTYRTITRAGFGQDPGARRSEPGRDDERRGDDRHGS
jgi:ATP synthase protein I